MIIQHYIFCFHIIGEHKNSTNQSNPDYKYFSRSPETGKRIHIEDPLGDEFLQSSNYRAHTYTIQLAPEESIIKTSQEILKILNTELTEYPIDLVIMPIPLNILKKYAKLEKTDHSLEPKRQKIIETLPLNQIRQALIDTIQQSKPNINKKKK